MIMLLFLKIFNGSHCPLDFIPVLHPGIKAVHSLTSTSRPLCVLILSSGRLTRLMLAFSMSVLSCLSPRCFMLTSCTWTHHKYLVFIYKPFQPTNTYTIYIAFLPCAQQQVIGGRRVFELGTLAHRIKHWSLVPLPQEMMAKAVLLV